MSLPMKPLLTSDTIEKRVKELGAKITADYRHKDLVVIGVLKGSFIFLADLVRQIHLPLQVEFIGVSSYEGTKSTGEVRITCDLSIEVKDKDILVVEDIVDTGHTIDFLLHSLQVRKPKSLKIAALLSKPEAHVMDHKVDYTGFEISKEFVIGYGLDLDGAYRGLKDIMQVIEGPTNPQ